MACYVHTASQDNISAVVHSWVRFAGPVTPARCRSRKPYPAGTPQHDRLACANDVRHLMKHISVDHACHAPSQVANEARSTTEACGMHAMRCCASSAWRCNEHVSYVTHYTCNVHMQALAGALKTVCTHQPHGQAVTFANLLMADS